jgi:pyridoxal biosynthesis lyase PdxS
MLRAIPDRRRSPSDGLVVEASVVARLLGLRLLTLHARVVVAPADVTAAPAPARSSGMPPARSGAAGRGLAEAIQRINEGAAILAETRHAGSPHHDGRDAGVRRRSRALSQGRVGTVAP